jgi:translation initiation factor IF-2
MMADKPIELVAAPMTVADFAEKLQIPANALIVHLLRNGIVATRNQVLSEHVIEQAAAFYGVRLVKPEVKAAAVQDLKTAVAGDKKVVRLPIVVVMGHVDHGKTTLLDFIRNTRVASREKGGITQHLGAYRAKTNKGDIVFLDTPGHEAFSMIRARGVTVADIAILIVAADDGVMPQTIEALERARAAELPLIVALNKVDKATPKQIEEVKTQLSRHNIIPEDWGGQTPFVLISAKTGQGVDDLLDIVILQSELMDLQATLDVPASGYILESHLEKGRGPVATVICHNGVLRVGDSFMCGSVQGRISSLKDSSGAFIQSVEPSIPVQVAGFSASPHVGDILKVVSAKELKRGVREEERLLTKATQSMQEGSLGLIVKTDNRSSLEAVLASLQKLTQKTYRNLYVIRSDIGAITESDVVLAADTGSMIYGLHVKVESNAALLIQRLGITVRLFDIIYKLLEDLEVVAQEGRPVKMKRKKIGEATVLKVFDIKKLGIVAGAQVTDGYCSREGTMVIYRGKHKVGSGKITSLQKEKSAVKEVRKGFECAFMVDGFDNWQVDDRVECYIEVPEEA